MLSEKIIYFIRFVDNEMNPLFKPGSAQSKVYVTCIYDRIKLCQSVNFRMTEMKLKGEWKADFFLQSPFQNSHLTSSLLTGAYLYFDMQAKSRSFYLYIVLQKLKW